MSNDDFKLVKFWDIFKRGQNGSLITKVPVRIGLARFEPETVIDRGAQLGGIDFHQHIDREIAVAVTPAGLYIIKGIYIPE